MIDATTLAAYFGQNIDICKQQLAGLSHEACLLQPQPRGNCMNWVLGHIVDTRNTVLKLLGQEGYDAEAIRARYGHGSEPVLCDAEGVVPMGELVAMLEKGQERITAALKAATEEELAVEAETFRGPRTVADQIFFFYYHDTYHTGQTEILRQLAGTNDCVI
jgi:uncharacterized damage-inducible protein DinB